MAMFCRVLATWLMDVRNTMDLISTLWVGQQAPSETYSWGHRTDKDVAKVRVVMKALDSWIRKNMTKTS
jgi:hypothetical protein